MCAVSCSALVFGSVIGVLLLVQQIQQTDLHNFYHPFVIIIN